MKKFAEKFCFLSILLLITSIISAQSRGIKLKPGMIKPQIKVELQSLAKHYMRVCPVEVKMTGKITVSAPITLKYRFERSEGGEARFIQLTLPKGEKTLPFKWKLNKNGQFWVELVVVFAGKEFRSGKREFNVKCNSDTRKLDRKLTEKKFHLEQIGQVRLINLDPVLKQSDYKMSVIPKVADLKIGGIKVYPEPGKYARKIKFKIRVKNISQIREGYSKSCYLSIQFSFVKTDPSVVYYKSEKYYYVIPEIGSGSEVTLELYWRFFDQAKWRVYVCADAKKTVHEIDEENNCYARRFRIFY